VNVLYFLLRGERAFGARPPDHQAITPSNHQTETEDRPPKCRWTARLHRAIDPPWERAGGWSVSIRQTNSMRPVFWAWATLGARVSSFCAQTAVSPVRTLLGGYRCGLRTTSALQPSYTWPMQTSH